MTDRGIIFSAPMVRALIEGRKTQTRRLATSPLRRCVPGDRLCVRETYGLHFIWSGYLATRIPDPERCCIFYAADGTIRGDCTAAQRETNWRPSIHMPRWASRLTLIVEAVRVEPLQAISAEDAIAEGTSCYVCDGGRVDGTSENDCLCFHSRSAAVPSYQALWESLHGAGSWEANPQVVAITFRVERANIDALKEAA